jgi:hypothetical protein
VQKLKEESVKGEHIEWEELKREHSLWNLNLGERFTRDDKFATRREYKGSCRFYRVFGGEEKEISEKGRERKRTLYLM